VGVISSTPTHGISLTAPSLQQPLPWQDGKGEAKAALRKLQGRFLHITGTTFRHSFTMAALY
jgi:hypothetical protein